MLLQVRNIRGIGRADIELKPTAKSPGIALICATNGEGKSSTAEAARIALTRNLYPRGLSAGTSGLLVKSGQDAGTIVLSSVDGSVSINYPNPKPRTDKRPPWSSTYGAGVEVLTHQEDKVKSRILTEYLKSMPTEAEFYAACKDIDIDGARAQEVWKNVTVLEWEGAREKEREKGAKLKGRWEQVAGIKYGADRANPKSASAWKPEGYEDLSPKEVYTQGYYDDRVKAARTLLEKAVRQDAVTESEIEGLKATAALFDERITECHRLDLEYAEAEKAVEVAKQKKTDFAKTGSNDIQLTWPCYSCGVENALINDKLVKPLTDGPQTREQYQVFTDELKRLGQLESQAQGHRDTMRDERTRCNGVANESKRAQETVANFSGNKSPRADIEGARRDLAQCELAADAKRQKQAADDIQADIVKQIALVGLLDATGLRQAKLSAKLAAFNGQMEGLCRVAGWEPVTIKPDLSISMGNYSYAMLAESEQLKTDTVLQLIFAILDESQAVVIDTTDRLDAKGRSGLFKLLLHCKIPAVVCQMVNKKEDALDLASKGLGITYWIEGAAAEPLAA